MKKQDIEKEINKPFNCKKNCGKCCTLTAFTQKEKEALGEVANNYAWVEIGKALCPLPKDGIEGNSMQDALGKTSCVFLDKNKRCTIYDKRPLVCRLFGRTETLICPEGVKPKKVLKEKDAQKLFKG